MLDRTQSQRFWGAAKRSVNPPVIRDNKATIDITHTVSYTHLDVYKRQLQLRSVDGLREHVRRQCDPA